MQFAAKLCNIICDNDDDQNMCLKTCLIFKYFSLAFDVDAFG